MGKMSRDSPLPEDRDAGRSSGCRHINVAGMPMTNLIEHVAELTGFRDRELLDVAVVRAVNDVLRPLSVAVYRCVGEPGDQHWLTRARMGAGDSAVSADP